ncbi:MAG: restriction endonuclease [Elusimicrobiota bacterium]|jgi:hypothetical protein
MAFPEAVHEVFSHFLTEFLPTQKESKLADYVLGFLSKRYAVEFAEEITEKYLKPISERLMDEYEYRRKEKELLRFRFLDAEGTRIAGVGRTWQSRLRIFQDAINNLTAVEFEALSARVLALLGCGQVWVTPQSHDQGLDAFGYAPVHSRKVPQDIASQCRLVYLAQAKHYKKHKVGSRDIREFVGSVELAVHKIFSTHDTKYSDLEIRPFGPSILVFVTTEELPRTVRLMGKNAGIIIVSAQNLAALFLRARILRTSNWRRQRIISALRVSIRNLPVAE